jgi:hypothetical protein
MRLAMLRMVKLRGATSPRSTFLPGAQGGDRGAGSRTNSVSSGERGAVVVATGVDENAATAIHFVKLSCEIRGITHYQ